MGQDSKDQEQLTLATAELRKYFEHDPSFYVVGGIATNSGGMVLVEVQQKLPNGQVRELVVKRVMKDNSKGLTYERTKCLEKEIQILTALQGAEHIVQRVVLNPDPLQKPLPGEQTGITGPYLVMEKLRLGTLDAFIRKYAEAPYPIPNRVLWAIFLSLTKACIAMAWPPQQPDNSPTTDETPGAGPAGNLIHLDISPFNIMFDFPGSEYDLIPRLKLIDFGHSRINGGKDYVYKEDVGYHENVYRIGKHAPARQVMLSLIFRDPRTQIVETSSVSLPAEDGGTATVAVDWGRTGGDPQAEIPGLDRDLHALVVLCLVARPSQRPSLPALLAQARAGAARTRDDYVRMGSQYYELENDVLITNVMNYVFRDGKPPVPDAGLAG
ncbi:hypothetical protein F4775DRAFT_606056 [Biscogniauxia sp. FL1348]|nr:hypothetical protein F4775DRAFT_606056 [Biscogniauxia sp. FL1348]